MVGNFEGGLEGFYSDTFPLYHQFVYQFDRLFEKQLPKLKHHFDQIGYPAPVWLQKWFMTLFLYSFPLKLCIRLWDNLLVEGLVMIFKFPLAIMTILENVLIKWNFEEVNDVLSNLRTIDDTNTTTTQTWLPNTEKIITKARNIKLDAEELRSLKNEYLEMQKEVDKIKDHSRYHNLLPKILEEAEIYEEVKKYDIKALSQQDENDDSLEVVEDIDDMSPKKLRRPNSAEMRYELMNIQRNI